jgi:hypothetical protein
MSRRPGLVVVSVAAMWFADHFAQEARAQFSPSLSAAIMLIWLG